MDLVAAHTAKHPHRTALIEGERSLTWEQFFRTRNRLAHSLAGLGIGAGQHVIVYAHNALENLVAGAALRALGAIGVPMNHRLTAEEVAYILDNADARAVCVGDAFLPMAERVRGAARVKRWITLGPERRPWAEALDDLLAQGSEAPPPAVPAMGGSMIYTAGTTGKPKGARRRVTDPAAILPRLAALDCLDPAQVHLVAGPLYHSAPGGFALYALYGSTELGVNTVLRPEDVLRKPGSCGRAAPGVELAILDDDGRRAAPGTPGELFVRRYEGVFDEYYGNPTATAQTSRGEWMSVGDVAWMDDEGFVYICDRKRDMIISGGVNIYPAEIEDALHRHPAVEDAAVFGVPDAEWGERVHAAIQLRPGERVTERELMDFCRAHLADYKAPREVSFHDDFPRDTAGKLVKRLLREPYWAGRTTRV